jgi:hypothetical protein
MRSSCKAFSQLVISLQSEFQDSQVYTEKPCLEGKKKKKKRGGPIVGGAIPGLAVLGSIRKQAEQASRSKPVSNIPPWPQHQLLLPDLLEFQS